MAMSGVWGKLWGADPLMTSETDKTTDTSIKDDTKSTDDAGTEADPIGDDHGDPPVAVDAFGEIETPPLTDIGIGGGTQANGGAATDGKELEEGSVSTDGTETALTTKELTEVKGQMTPDDKEKLFALFMSKLPQDSWQTISQYVENGLTEQELTTIQQIMAQHLDKTEYGEMMEILKKY